MSPNVLPVYFFPGPEIGRKKKRIQSLVDALTMLCGGEPPEKSNFFPYDTSALEIVSVLRGRSLFSNKRFVTVSDVHALKKNDMAVLKEYLTHPVSDAVLVLTTDLSPGVREYPRALENLLPKTAVEVFWEMFEQNKRKHVLSIFQEQGVRIHPKALDYLLDITDGTADALREAVDLILLSAGKENIVNEETVGTILEHSRSETVYSLFDRLCRRNLTSVLESYRKIVHADLSIGDRVLSMLVEPLVKLRDYKAFTEKGISSAAAIQKLNIRGGKRALRSYAEGVQNFGMGELDRAVESLVNTEVRSRAVPRSLRLIETEIWICRTVNP